MSSSSSNFNFMFENFTGEGDVSSSMVAILGTLKGALLPHVEDEFLVKPHSTPIYSKAAVAVVITGDLISISETNVMSTGCAISRLCDTSEFKKYICPILGFNERDNFAILTIFLTDRRLHA
uniref:Uncharacterized protein n=1 Tax=Glossina palpalis gambiensis TaxID=67801 RepID=A0A1B0AVA4_9MUSC